MRAGRCPTYGESFGLTLAGLSENQQDRGKGGRTVTPSVQKDLSLGVISQCGGGFGLVGGWFFGVFGGGVGGCWGGVVCVGFWVGGGGGGGVRNQVVRYGQVNTSKR